MRQLLSLRLRIPLLVAGSLLPLLIFSASIVYSDYQQDQAEATERVLQVARGTIAAVDRELDSVTAALQVLALSASLQSGDFEDFRTQADRFAGRYPPGHAVAIADRDGRQLFNSRVPAGEPLPPRTQRAATAEVFESRRATVSDLFIGSVVRQLIFTIDVPVIRNGEVIYDLSFNPSIETFRSLITQQSLPDDWVISIFDRSGMHVARRPALAPGVQSGAAPQLRDLMAGRVEGVGYTTSLEGRPLLTAFSRSRDSGWIAAIGIPSESIARAAWRALWWTFGIGLASLLVGLGFSLRLASELTRAEAHRELLINELNHRVKNTLATVQSIASQTLRTTPDSADARQAIEARLLALSRAHNVLGEENWEGAQLREIIARVLEPYAAAEPARLNLLGDDLRLRPRAALTLAMVLNELATNATKYGALSKPGGRVSIVWELAGAVLRLRWHEIDGPPVIPPARSGFGTTLIERSVRHELQGTATLAYDAHGLTCTIEIPATVLGEAPPVSHAAVAASAGL